MKNQKRKTPSASAWTPRMKCPATRSASAWIGAFGDLRLLDEVDDLRERSAGADACGAEAEGAGLVDRAADDLVALTLLDGDAFAGDHRLVDSRVAIDHNAVDGDAVSGTDDADVADLDLVGRDLGLDALAEDEGALRLQSHEVADRLGRAAAGDGLEIATEHDKRDEQRGRLVEGRALTAEAGFREDGIDDCDAVRGADTGGVEQVHVGDAADQAVPGVDEELTAGAEDERRGEEEEEPLLAHERRHDALERLVLGEGAEHDEHRQRPGDQHVDLLAADFVLAQLPLAVDRVFALALLRHVVAEIADRLLDRSGGDGRVQELDRDGVSRRVDRDAATPGIARSAPPMMMSQ